MRTFISLASLCLSLSITSAMPARAADERPWQDRVYSVSAGAEVDARAMADDLAGARNVVLAEKHYTPIVQKAEGEVITLVAAAARSEGFATAWEFLNHSDQESINALFAQFVSGAITAQDFLMKTQGVPEAASYAPILEATRASRGQLYGLNLPREQKDPVVKGGLAAADPSVIPPGFALGGENYHERFVAAMSGGHATPAQMENYFAAQCLTDDVMAYHLIHDTGSARLRFAVMGSFHADYFDGTVARIRVRAPGDETRVVRFIDASDFAPGELESKLPGILNDPKYGAIADYVYFVGEPQAGISAVR